MMQLAEKLQNAADRQRFSGIINLAEPLKIMCWDRGNKRMHTYAYSNVHHMQKWDTVSKLQS